MDWIAGKRDWRQFYRFKVKIGRIPGSSYHSALMLDQDLAEEAEKLPKAKNPPLFRFDNLMHRITDLCDIVLKQAVANGGGDAASVALPRPLTAADHLKLAKRQAAMNKTVATWFPAYAHLTPKLTHKVE